MVMTYPALSSFAYKCSPDTVKCPIDGQQVVFCVTMSMTTFGSYYDFQKQGAIGEHYEELINSCTKCHYAGYMDDFKTIYSSDQKSSILELLKSYVSIQIDNSKECEIAAKLHSLLNDKSDRIANIYLIGSYLIRTDSSQIVLRREMQSLSAEYFQKALSEKSYNVQEIPIINYLVGELYRRVEMFEKAIVFYNLCISNKKAENWIIKMAKEQKKLAEIKDSNNNI